MDTAAPVDLTATLIPFTTDASVTKITSKLQLVALPTVLTNNDSKTASVLTNAFKLMKFISMEDVSATKTTKESTVSVLSLA